MIDGQHFGEDEPPSRFLAFVILSVELAIIAWMLRGAFVLWRFATHG